MCVQGIRALLFGEYAWNRHAPVSQGGWDAEGGSGGSVGGSEGASEKGSESALVRRVCGWEEAAEHVYAHKHMYHALHAERLHTDTSRKGEGKAEGDGDGREGSHRDE